MTTIGNSDITYEDVVRVSRLEKVSLGKTAIQKVQNTRKLLEKSLTDKSVIYGVTTGFGAFKNTAIDSDNLKKLQENLILSHAVGVGDPFSPEISRGMMFIIANYLSKGYSGARTLVIQTLIEMLNKNVVPVIPQKGSVGSSGDLAPSAHLVLVMLGKGEAYYKGKKMKGEKAMKLAKIKPIILEAKEGLALINNTSAMCSVGSQALFQSKRLLEIADLSASLSTEALRGTTKAFDARIHSIKPHNGQVAVAQNLRKTLKGSTMIDNTKVQDQYSLRCIPQIHGAVRETFSHVEKVINTELNSVTDNPLIFTENGKLEVISGGNFHGEPVAMVMDFLAIAISELANISDRRIASLLDPATNNGLPAFLTEDGGVNSGMMILQYTTAALASENKILAHPASVDSIPTSANIEDLVSMGTIAARKCLEICKNVEHVLTIEALVSCQAIDFRLKEGYKLGAETERIFKRIRKVVPFFKVDATYSLYFDKIKSVLEIYS
ncbi:MAG: Histidine ammonia-lyase [Microgenomates group bacterium GW2011_GWA2_37_6]|nr:MAG: Histidine ammonia-lyase [Microgenomates group bacterium GW2011_GWA2_37_6]